MYSRGTLTIENAYFTLFSKEKIKNLVRFEARDGEGLVVHDGHGRSMSKSNFSDQVFFIARK